MAFINDDWELDTKTGEITTNSPFGKKTIAEVFGATDFNTDNEQAMTYARLIKAAPTMYYSLKKFFNFASKIINDVEGKDTQGGTDLA